MCFARSTDTAYRICYDDGSSQAAKQRRCEKWRSVVADKRHRGASQLRASSSATTKLATEGLTEQGNILTAFNIEHATFLEKWKKQPGGSQHDSQLPSARDTTLSAPVCQRSPSVSANIRSELNQTQARPALHEQGHTAEARSHTSLTPTRSSSISWLS
ncbi:hypothetical protein HBH70_246540 [Parastagonospora nodorum]|nr:hypothetical protein HBH53_193130 [Parastagonospora nodorum]KAH4043899.1 hypothetical protein HBH49_227910 [Parastagonospora nodorum]KAH4095230.1 hypothetical protein HBH46_172210 [Parastagonospora nodorum]KAH4115417.1 hypothetical protein HBH47_180470 [Parastagonospora nodorum]KAH5126196.1 hypothetical protein HBH70_246540 [Parastagonospora nodorum]